MLQDGKRVCARYQRHFEDDLPLRTLPLTENELKDGPGTAAAAGAVPPGLFWGV